MNGKKIAYWLIRIGAFISLFLLILYLAKTTKLNLSSEIDINVFSSYGTLVGGILGALFSLAGVFLLIATLEAQEKAISIQEKNYEKQLFESKFFDLIKMYRDNSVEINIKDRYGKKVFLMMQREFYQCKLIIDAYNETLIDKLSEHDRINIAYLSFFFGAVGETSEVILKERLSEYNLHVPYIIEMFKKSQEGIRESEKFPYEPFEGHQSRLGHYFRHLYQTVKYVDEQPRDLFSYKNKYSYLKILRAQLSTQEQAFLFLNSLSDLGKAWEKKEGLNDNQKLITKYNLIKNIPTGYTHGINVRDYYPQVKFEGDQKKQERDLLEKKYF